jgi:hypothetical protein
MGQIISNTVPAYSRSLLISGFDLNGRAGMSGKTPNITLSLFYSSQTVNKADRQEYLTTAFSFPMLSLAFQP